MIWPRYSPPAPPSRGKFIVLEGLDGAGTTTQASLLATDLASRGIDVEITREPSDGPVGQLCRDAIEGRISLTPQALALSFAADRLQHLNDISDGINAALDRGTWIISDRYVLSALAYQASQGVDLEWLAAINSQAQSPDVTIFVDTSTSTCLDRIRKRGQNEDDLFHNSGRLTQVQAEYARVLNFPNFIGSLVTADGDNDVETVFRQIQEGLAQKALLTQPSSHAARLSA